MWEEGRIRPCSLNNNLFNGDSFFSLLSSSHPVRWNILITTLREEEEWGGDQKRTSRINGPRKMEQLDPEKRDTYNQCDEKYEMK